MKSLNSFFFYISKEEYLYPLDCFWIRYQTTRNPCFWQNQYSTQSHKNFGILKILDYLFRSEEKMKDGCSIKGDFMWLNCNVIQLLWTWRWNSEVASSFEKNPNAFVRWKIQKENPKCIPPPPHCLPSLSPLFSHVGHSSNRNHTPLPTNSIWADRINHAIFQTILQICDMWSERASWCLLNSFRADGWTPLATFDCHLSTCNPGTRADFPSKWNLRQQTAETLCK